MNISMRHSDIRRDRRTDSGRHDDMAILSFPHNGQHSFDNVDIGEEVGLEGVLHKGEGPIALRQLFNGSDDG